MSEAMAALVALVRAHGITVARHHPGGGTHDIACLAFAGVPDAVEFLEQTAHLMDYRMGTNLALTLLPPTLETPHPGAQVSWLAEDTAAIAAAWG